jgi:hypothetical protein
MRDDLDLRVEHLYIEIERFLAIAVEVKIGIDLHHRSSG